MIENTEFIIEKYRQKYKGYYGDSCLNILGDIVFMIIGYILCYHSQCFGIFLLVFIEIWMYPYNANLYQLSIGSITNNK